MQAAAAPTRWNPGTCAAAVALLHWVPGFGGDAGAQEGGGEAGEIGEFEPIALQELSYSVAGWKVDDGLLENRVDAIAQTRDGYLWVGTTAGLVRFNGVEFKAPGEGEGEGDLAAALRRRVHNLRCDSSGRLWITTVDPGVIVYEEGRFRRLFAPGKFRGSPINRLAETSSGTVVAIVKKDGGNQLLRFGAEGFEPIPGLPSSSGLGDLIRIASVSDGRYLIQVRRKAIFEAGAGDGHWRRVDLAEGVQPAGALYRRGDGSLAVVAPPGEFVCDNGSGKWSLSRPFGTAVTGRLTNTVAGDEDLLWMQRINRAPLVALPDGEVRELDLAGAASSFSNVNTLFLDRQRNLWVGSQNGLFRLRFSPFTTWSRARGLPAHRVITLAEDGHGTMWFAGVGALGFLERGASHVSEHPEKPDYHQYVAAGNPAGGVWLTDADCSVSLFETGGFTHFNAPVLPGGSSTQRIGVCTDRDGVLWVGSYHGLFRLDPTARSPRLELYRTGDTFSGRRIQALARPPGAGILAAVTQGGIYRVGDTAPPERLTDARDPAGNRCRAVAIEDDGGLWAVTIGEALLGHWKGGASLHSSLGELGFAGCDVAGIATDRLGGVWFMTVRHGVARADGAALVAAMESGAKPPDLLTWFGRPEGLPTVSCSFAPGGILRGSDGRIWVATSDGAAVADPRRVLHQIGAQREQRVPLHLEGVSVDGVASGLSTQPDAPVVVAPGTKSVTFRFASLDLRSPEDRRYRHRLIGLDDAWSEADDRNTATFLAIPAGDYRFEVTSVDPHGQPAPPSASVALVVQPAWYERKSVRAGGVLGAVGLLWLAFARRLALARQRQSMVENFSRQLIASGEQERKRIASELHDSLGQDLLLIKNSTEMSLMGIGREGTQEERLQEISTLASHAIAEVRTVIDNLRPPELDRIGLNAAVETMAASVTGHTGVKVTADLAELPAAWLREHDIALYRITQEAVNNAVKHASATGITVRTALREGQVALEISDDGAGFEPASESATAGNGLANLRERAALLGGTMQLRSAPGAGTRINFTFPATQ